MSKSNQIGTRLGVLLLAFAILGCQKPQLKSAKSQESEEKAISKEPEETHEELRESVSEPGLSSGKSSMEIEEPAKVPVIQKPKTNSRERALEIARRQKELEAQLAGIRNLESDLARHSQVLNALRRQQQSLRALQSSKRSGGLRVERINGKSAVVDRRGQLKEVEGKLKAEEQIVTQFAKSLQAARQKYQNMRVALDRLRRE